MGRCLTSNRIIPHPTIEKEKEKYHNLKKKYKRPKVGKRLRGIFLGLCQTLGPTCGLRIALKTTTLCLGRNNKGLGLGPLLLVWTLT